MTDQRASGADGPVRRVRSKGPRRLSLVAAILVCAALQSGVAAAQHGETASADGATIEEIVVTGTRINRRDFITSSPLVTVSSDHIRFSGQPTLEETLNQLPQVLPQPGRSSNYNASADAGVGAAFVDLRGLGAGRSLVLLNGRRVAPSGVGNAVDLNLIPQFLVERIEIITGGASAVYGSDAIAGVVNLITKKDYSGVGIEASATMADAGDAETYDVNVVFGHNFANGRGNVSVFANWMERESLLASEREFTSVYYEEDWEGNLVPTGSSRTAAGAVLWPAADLGDGPVQVTFNPDGTPREYVHELDHYNFAEVSYLQVPIDRRAIGAIGHYDLAGSVEAYFEASYVRNEPERNMAPTPSFEFAMVNLDNPVLTPESRQLFSDYYVCGPNIACIAFARRLVELGPRRVKDERDYYRLLAGVRGEFREGWAIDAWATYTSESTTTYLRGDASRSRLLQGLLVDPASSECFDPSGGCVPLDLFGEGRLSSEGVEFLRFPPYENDTERTHKLASVVVSGSPIETWAGPVDTALGIEWRSEDTRFDPDEALYTGDALGYFSLDPIGGKTEVLEAYAEAIVPLASDLRWADYLGLEIGVRYSDYEHSGGSWTYKLGGEWRPVDGLGIRAMHQRSARAPNARELFEEQRLSEGVFVWDDVRDDPCSASADPVGTGIVDKCVLQGLPADQVGIFEATPFYPVEYLTGGNPDLDPETGETLTLGIVLSPVALPHWNFAVDYFLIELEDAIGNIDAASICFSAENTSNVFCDKLSRDATGNVAEIEELLNNRGLVETEGIDTQITYARELEQGIGNRPGKVSAELSWTHLLSYKVQENPATEVLDCAGYFGWPCLRGNGTHPEDRVTANLHYSTGPVSAHLTWRWIDGTDNAMPMMAYIWGIPAPDLAVPSINSENYVDLGLSYEFDEALLVRFGANNLLDNDAPMMGGAVSVFNTDTGLYDVFGRSYYLTLSAEF